MLSAIFLIAAAIALPPKPEHYVTDAAHALDPSRGRAINEKLAQFERATSDQILVYVDDHVPSGTTMEEMSGEAIRSWDVGQKGKDNGAILFVFIADRKMRIEVGYGLEGSLTDARASQIITNVIAPEFRRGDYAGGIDKGTDAMIDAIRGEPYRGSGSTVAESTVKTWGKRLVYGAEWVLRYSVFLIALFAFFIVPFFSSIRRGQGGDVTFSSSGSSPFSSGGDTWDSSSSESSFSGGGGSGGGGGASGSW